MQSQQISQNERENVLKLASEIEQVNEIFVDLADLVNTQGESIENIETSIESTQKFTDSANTQLLQAKSYQKKTRCCNKFICICTGIAITIVIILIITIPMS
jgi:t-SNARE complex subunit (syntaxin)